MTESEPEFEIVVVGAGPAGLSAACAAAESGAKTALLDDTPWLGGQIWRGQECHPSHAQAGNLFTRFHKSGATLLRGTSVVAAPQPGLLLAERNQRPYQVRWRKLILATGARELFLPFPGWTLPGNFGPGGLLSLAKNGWPVNDRRVVITGSGPLLLAAAEGLRRHGARVKVIVEQAPWRQVMSFGITLGFHGKLAQALRLKLGLLGIPYRCDTWVTRAEGDDRVRSVTLTNDGRTWQEECDFLACGFGLVPNVELPLALGCELQKGVVSVDTLQATSVPNVYCAGEPTGIAGADSALVQGRIAGYIAAGQANKAKALIAERDSWHKFGAALARTFSLRPELKALADDDTLLCRCEDVPLGRARQFNSWRAAKLHSRCGMGPCQGRVCGAALKVLLGWEIDSVRPPILPARIDSLVSQKPPEKSSSDSTASKTPGQGSGAGSVEAGPKLFAGA